MLGSDFRLAHCPRCGDIKKVSTSQNTVTDCPNCGQQRYKTIDEEEFEALLNSMTVEEG